MDYVLPPLKRKQYEHDHLVLRLEKEIIDLKEAIMRTDRDPAQSVDSITENITRISDLLQEISNKTRDNQDLLSRCMDRTPIHELLSVGPLTIMKIPQELLKAFITVGFDVNRFNANDQTCLDVAIEKHHYNAVRLLIMNSAKSVSDFDQNRGHPISELAIQSNVPLDLFDLLATPQNLNHDTLFSPFLPLHRAVSAGHTATAFHLIKLGASVDQTDGFLRRPIDYFVNDNTDPFNNELFRSLLPTRGHGVGVLRPICRILDDKQFNKANTCLLGMLQQLLQRLRFYDKHLELEVFLKDVLVVVINDVRLYIYTTKPCSVLYLCSLILVELQLDLTLPQQQIADRVASTVTEMELTYAHAIDDMWSNYSQQCRVKSLLRLCILCTRKSMNGMDDESFLSLPVPPYIRKLLTYQDVAKKIFEHGCHGPPVLI